MACQDKTTIVTGVKPLLEPLPNSTNVQRSFTYTTETISLGQAVKILPKVNSDGRSISLTVEGYITEFQGYDKPTKDEAVTLTTPGGEPLTAVRPFPRFLVRELSGQATILNGQTLLLGGPVSFGPVKSVSDMPFLSKIPIVSQFSHRESTRQEKRTLFVLITATIIDATGNPITP